MSEEPKELAGAKNDDGKIRYDLLPWHFLEQVAKAMTYGANKYGAYNYRKGLVWSRQYAACERHIQSWRSGEDIDPESGLPHLALATANILMLMDGQRGNYGKDDR